MRRKITIAAVSAALILILSAFVFADMISAGDEENTDSRADTAAVGTWYLSCYNDMDVLNEAFPDIYAFGSELVVRPDKKIYWHIGAAGAAGTYEAYGNQLSACVSEIMEPDEYRVAITLDDDGKLIMKYRSVPLEWTFASGTYE